MTDKELKIKALESATKIAYNAESLKTISEEIYQWLKIEENS